MNAIPDTTELQRSHGCVRLQFKIRDANNDPKTVLGNLYQEGCCKVRFPQTDTNQSMEAVLINTAGGLTDGDQVSTEVDWMAETQAIVSTQAAERIYKSRHHPASINTTLSVGENARACWLPQETILFDGGRFQRDTRLDLHSSAAFFGVESLVFGRTAMGEYLESGFVSERWQVHIGEKLVLADAFLLDDTLHGNIQEHLKRPCIANGALCIATLIVVQADCQALLQPLRETLNTATGISESGISGAASCLGPLLVVRLMADNSRILRALIVQLFKLVQDKSQTLPRVWEC